MEQQLRDLLGQAFHSLTRTPVGHEARAQISDRSAGASLVAAEATEAYALALLALIGARSGGVDGRRTGQQVRGVTSAEPAGPAGRRILAWVDGSDEALRARALSDQGGRTPSEGACGSSTSPTPARSSPGMWYLVVTTEALPAGKFDDRRGGGRGGHRAGAARRARHLRVEVGLAADVLAQLSGPADLQVV